MKYIKKMVFVLMMTMLLVGCSAPGASNQMVSKEALERGTMTKVQNDVNVIMDKNYNYVLKNMGSPYSTIYSLKVDNKEDFKNIEKIKDVDIGKIDILSTGLLYPKYTSDYKLDGSAIYIGFDNKKVNQVETCDFKNFDISQVMNENSDVVISAYTDYSNIDKENIENKDLTKYIGKEKDKISKIIKNKKAQYNIYMNMDEVVNVDIYNIKNGDFLMVAYEDESIIYIGEQDCSGILSKIQENLN